MKYLGIDHGEKKIGLAIAESEVKIATPFKIIIKDKNLIANIKEICLQEEIDKIIVGVPLGLKNTKSEQYEKVMKFIKKLEKNVSQKIITQDEKLTSQYAQRLLRGTKAKKFDDDVAAMLILQSYLDKNL